MRRLMIGLAITAAGALGITACSSSTGGHPVNTGAGHSSPNAPTSTSHTSHTSTGGGGLTEQQAQAALLTAAEVGGGVKSQVSDDTSTPLPCNHAPPLDQQFRPVAKAKADFVSPDEQAYLSEEVIGYDGDSTAARALAAGEKGLDCRTATVPVNGRPVKYEIQPAQDITSQVGVKVDKSVLWRVHTSVVDIQLVATKIGAQLVVVSFAATPKADTGSLADPSKILAAALTKAKAHF